MRPKLLEIEGLQSFRELQRIDFETLGETGLFGIFGPTGSGKSTILDAITFALYGKVKRADRGTQGIINANQNDTRVSYTFELLREGNRKIYRVEREYKRKKHSENSCMPKVARLIEVTEVGEIPLCDKASEVSNSVEELLGLSHEDFTRAVVLPQNSFQEFLFLDNAKKRDMLERIFYLEEYGKKLVEKLARKMSGLNSQRERLSGELAAYIDATDTALEEAKTSMEAAKAAREKLEKELKQLEGKYNENREVWGLVQELAEVEAHEQQHTASKEAIETKKLLLSKAEKSQGLQELINNSKELSQKLQETETKLQDRLSKLPEITSQLNDARENFETIKKEAERSRPKLVSQKTRLEEALKEKAAILALRGTAEELQKKGQKLLEQITQKQGTILEETGLLAAIEEKLESLHLEMEPLKVDPEYRQQLQEGAKLENQVTALHSTVEENWTKTENLKKSIEVLEQKLSSVKEAMVLSQQNLDKAEAERQAHEGAKPADRNAVFREKEELSGLERVFDVLRFRDKEITGLQTKLEAQQTSLRTVSERVEINKKAKEEAESACHQWRLKRDQARSAMDHHSAYLLSMQLQEGEPCPVCGSEHHPHLASQVENTEMALLEHQLALAEKEVAAAEKILKEAENKYLIAGEQVVTLQGQVTQAEQELEEKRREYYQAVQEGLPVELRDLELDRLHQELEARKAAGVEKQVAIESWEKQQEEFRDKLNEITEILSRHRLEEKGLSAQLKVNRDNRLQAEEALAQATELFEAKQQEYNAFLGQFALNSVAAELQRLSDNDRRLNVLSRNLEKGEQDKTRKKSLLDQLKEEFQGLNTEKVKVEADRTNNQKLLEEKENKVKDLAGDIDANIEEAIRGIDARLEGYRALEKQYTDNIKELETQHHAMTSDKSMFENQKDIYAGNLAKAEENLKVSLSQKGFTDAAEVEQSLLPIEEQQSLKDEIELYQQKGIEIHSRKETLQNKLGSRNIKEEEWNALSQAYQETAASKEECVSASEVARSRFGTLKTRHDRWLELNQAFNKVTERYGLFEQIQKLLRADRGKDNSFIDFIAEERLRYVAAKASETLGVMTKYKYALELDTDAGFVIRDNANGGVCRMATSLSGGETFLTSLSLALALSEQIQLKGQSPLEFFFLDEGFGTLDNSLLDAVIDSLERLSSKERVIGLISHVPELRDRLARRLMVDPPTNGEGSRVRIEMA